MGEDLNQGGGRPRDAVGQAGPDFRCNEDAPEAPFRDCFLHAKRYIAAGRQLNFGE